jgi:hypothetical protein
MNRSRRLTTTIYVNLAYRRLPTPAKAVVWLPVLYVARLLGISFPPWP